MQQIFQDFITALRRSGVRISLSESVDALRAADLIGYGDREILKDALAVCLAKSVGEKDIFYSIFDRFFAPEVTSWGEEDFPRLSETELLGIRSPLAYMLLSGDAAGVGASIREAGQEAGIVHIQYSAQKGVYVRKILERLGWTSLLEEIRRLEEQSDQSLAERLNDQKEALYRKVKDHVEQQFKLFADSSPEAIAENLIGMSLSKVEERDYERLDALIRRMVKRLNTLHSRRRHVSKSGRIDVRGMLRKSIPFQGVPFEIRWKAKKVERANIVAICDVSRSVRTAVRFLLLFLYNLSHTLARTRTFIFCSNLVEVSALFDKYPVGEAIARIQTGTGLGMNLGLTDYGQAFNDFKAKYEATVTGKTTVIVLGDARNNYGDPGIDVLEWLARRSKRLFWLNPESRSQWGTGDSEMKRYLPYCHVARQCRSVKDFDRAMDALLKQYG